MKLRFSLRLLFCLTVAVCGIFGLVAMTRASFERTVKAIQALEGKYGATIYYDDDANDSKPHWNLWNLLRGRRPYNSPNIVQIERVNFDARCSELLAQLNEVTTLLFEKIEFEDSAIRGLRDLSRLQVLAFEECSIPTTLRPAVLCQRRLQSLDIWQTGLSDQEIDDMLRMNTSLETFMLVDRGFSDETLRNLGRNQILEHLGLGMSAFPTETMQRLAGDQLKTLFLSNMKLSAAEIAIVAKFTGLERLDLKEIEFSNSAQLVLHKLPFAEYVSFLGSNLTDEGLRSFLHDDRTVSFLNLNGTAITSASLPLLDEAKLLTRDRFDSKVFFVDTAILDEDLSRFLSSKERDAAK